MTQPAPPPPKNQQDRVAALAALLASTMPVAALAAGFASLALIPQAMALRLIEQTPPHLATVAGHGPIVRAVIASEPAYRAAYLLAAAQRVHADVARGVPLEQALASEQRHTMAHQQAQANRLRAAAAVEQAATANRSSLLGWSARMDSRTSADCRAANGRNFSIFSPPAIGLPGSVHPNCRCRPVAAFAGAPMVGAVTTRKVAVA